MELKAETAVGLFVLAALGMLIYMSFQIGSLRFASHDYVKYCLYSHDVSGLNKKADVRIAGVKVGWIDEVIFEEELQRVLMCVMILKKYHLHENASSVIRQNGILGGKYLELIPGDAHLPKLSQNALLATVTQDSISVDVLMKKVSIIADNIEEITDSLRQALGGQDGVQAIKELVNGCISVTDKVSLCAETIERLVARNEESLENTVTDFNGLIIELKNSIPELQEKIGQISYAIDRDFNRVASQIESLMPSLTTVLESYLKNKGFVIKHKFRLF